MKNFIVYDLDNGLPVWAGESLNGEFARFEAQEKSGYRLANLFAEEIKNEEIVKNSKPNPRIMRRQDINRAAQANLQAMRRDEAETKQVLNNEALKRVERYSKALKEKLNKGEPLPRYEEWLKEGGDI